METRMLFDDDQNASHPALELEEPQPRVSIASLGCPRCGAPIAGDAAACAHCASPIHQHYSPHPPAWLATEAVEMPAPEAPIVSRKVGLVERVVDGLGEMPYDFWKRVAFYPFLVLLFGNSCTCRGLSPFANVMLAGAIAIGVLGVIGNVRGQRRL